MQTSGTCKPIYINDLRDWQPNSDAVRGLRPVRSDKVFSSPRQRGHIRSATFPPRTRRPLVRADPSTGPRYPVLPPRINGSSDSLNVSLRCGLRPNARQTRPTVNALNPQAVAIDSRLHYAARQRLQSADDALHIVETVRGAPGRGSSRRPSKPSSRNRRLHFPTVVRVVRSMLATCWPLSSSALLRMMRARNASACAVFLRHTQRSSSLRCSSETVGTTRVW